ncbi:MAG TPA: hypothetical protein VEY92_06940 [Pseudoxanthomonas sp.]|nr:hypothetical protein [Pseudoxanthomonas sp.]
MSLSATLIMAGCATREAANISGRWKAVNRYAEAPQEIPLYQSYVFYPSPMDGTLKKMLTRWAKDSGMTLSYLHPSDFTLYRAIAQVRTASVTDAAAQLSSIYAAQRVSIAVSGTQILVRAVDPVATQGTGDTADASR